MKRFRILPVIALLLLLVPAVMAGGWATITLDDAPGEIHAGEPWAVGFTVLQHGVTPVHNLGKDLPIVPKLTATNAVTGERLEALASRTEELGHFTVEITFPDEGEWEWAIEPRPLAGDTRFEPLTVLAPVNARNLSAVALGDASLAAVIGIAALVVALGALPWLYVRRRARPRPSEA